jgi:hypothetical protein
MSRLAFLPGVTDPGMGLEAGHGRGMLSRITIVTLAR